MSIQQMLLGVGAVATKTYVDDVFSTNVYVGSGSGQVINNGIDNSSEGGMVWFKRRDGTYDHQVVDTIRGGNKGIRPNLSNAEITTSYISSFNNNGYTLGTESAASGSGDKFAAWNFRKAKGFFDVVTYDGSSSAQNISHSLGCQPGMIIVKKTSGSDHWSVWHNTFSNTAQGNLTLSTSGTVGNDSTLWNNTAPTASVFSVGTNGKVNESGATYVAYLFGGGESDAATAVSVDFDGGDDLTLAASTDLDFGTGDFTVEFWYKGGSYTASSDRQAIIAANKAWGDGFHQIRISDVESARQNRIVIWDYDTNSNNPIFISNKEYPPHVWRHVAVTRTGGLLKVYVNGTLDKSISYTAAFNLSGGSGTKIGYNPANTGFVGELSNLRVVKGTAVYTSSFRPPTEPLTNITNTKLLCCNNSSTTGSTVTPGTITANGDPTASTDSPFDDPAAFTFGDAGDQNVIKTGSYVGNGNDDGPEIYLGFEPQWLLVKSATSSQSWIILDCIRNTGSGAAGEDAYLLANSDSTESGYDAISYSPTGFKLVNSAASTNEDGETFIYLALRRPDGYVGKQYGAGEGTSVFAMDTGAGSSTIPNFDSGFVVDMSMNRQPSTTQDWYLSTRLTAKQYLKPNAADGASTGNSYVFDSNVGWDAETNRGSGYQSWMWKRHAGFDCITFTGSFVGRQLPHSLNKIPEMVWVKRRSSGTERDWAVYHKGLNGGTNPEQYGLVLNSDAAEVDDLSLWNDTAPSSTHVTLGGSVATNSDTIDYIAMLFASVEGISKVGSFSGSSSDVTLNLGFVPRFLMVKARSGSQVTNWVIWDSQRGITGGGAATPRLYLNQDTAETTTNDNVATTSSGITIETGPYFNNASGYEYVYYAHA